MSLFDVIKYPINEEFLVEDLEAIPSDILSQWWFGSTSTRCEVLTSNWYKKVAMAHHIALSLKAAAPILRIELAASLKKFLSELP